MVVPSEWLSLSSDEKCGFLRRRIEILETVVASQDQKLAQLIRTSEHLAQLVPDTPRSMARS